MVELASLNNKCLLAVRMGKNHEKVHPAWQDETNDGFRICYEVSLFFDDKTTYLIEPCEIDISGRYPGLGLNLKVKEEVSLASSFFVPDLPMKVIEIIPNDHSGEDVVNQYIFVMEDGKKITIRHCYPPMTMGIKTELQNA